MGAGASTAGVVASSAKPFVPWDDVANVRLFFRASDATGSPVTVQPDLAGGANLTGSVPRLNHPTENRYGGSNVFDNLNRGSVATLSGNCAFFIRGRTVSNNLMFLFVISQSNKSRLTFGRNSSGAFLTALNNGEASTSSAQVAMSLTGGVDDTIGASLSGTTVTFFKNGAVHDTASLSDYTPSVSGASIEEGCVYYSNSGTSGGSSSSGWGSWSGGCIVGSSVSAAEAAAIHDWFVANAPP